MTINRIAYTVGVVLWGGLCVGCTRSPQTDDRVAGGGDRLRFVVETVVEGIEHGTDPWLDAVASKGVPLTDVKQMSSMGVFAFQTDTPWATSGAQATPEKMNHVRLNNRIDGGTQYWDYEAGKEVTWQGVARNQYVSFFGYSPIASPDNGISVLSSYGPGGDKGVPVIRYSVPTDVAKQPDLLATVPYKDALPTFNAIPLTYRHMLTAVGFKISGTGQKVKSISLRGISTQGDLQLDVPWRDNPVWSHVTPSAAATLFPVGIVPDAGQTYYTATATPTNIVAADGYLMMIPQRLTSNAVAIVEFEDQPSKAYLLDSKQWMPGRWVTYSINVAPTSIVVSPANWIDALSVSGTLEVTVTGAFWKATPEGTGLTISKTVGASGAKITLTWADNLGDPEPGKRFGTITFTAIAEGYGSAEFQTSQLGSVPPWVLYNGVQWAKGNLIADGAGGCTIGAPTDGGLYFQFGGLIGYKGGSDGSGVGRVNPAYNEKYWGGASAFDPINEIAVWPAELDGVGGSGTPNHWPQVTDKTKIGQWLFNIGVYPYDDENTAYQPNIVSFKSYAGVVEGTYYKRGIGDPCAYYLGAKWSLPSIYQARSLCNNPVNDGPWQDPALINATIDAGKTAVVFGGAVTLPISGTRGNSAGKFAGLTNVPSGGSPYVQYFFTDVWGELNARTFWYQWSFSAAHDIELYAAERAAATPIRCVYNP